MQGSILVIRGGAIGDFILTLPVLSALRRAFPQTRLEVLGYEHIANLAKTGGLADEVHPLGSRPLASFFGQDAPLPDELAAFFARFDLIISYLFDPDGIFRDNVKRCSQAQFIAGPHRPQEAEPVHATAVFLQPLEKLAIWDADPTPRLAIPPEKLPGDLRPLAFHPGSGSDKKNWPEARWEELVKRFETRTKKHLLLVGGEAEGDRLERLSSQATSDRVSQARHLPLPQLAARLAACEAFAGHDSGITHLVAALGLPVVALWGPTNEAVWKPRSERVKILKNPGGLEGITVEEVWKAMGG
jgi:ADP-heptose:LPS heptosyltransferase